MSRNVNRHRQIPAGGWRMRIAVAAAAFWTSAAANALTVLDFEDIPAPATITAQYGPRGVLFGGHFLRTDPTAHSGTQVLQSTNPSDFEFDPGPLTMTFTSAQSRVKLFAGVPIAPLTGTLRVYDANDALLGQDGPKQVAADTFNTVFEVSFATATILKAEFQLEGSAFEEIDDLEFEGEPPAPLPTQPPVVQITAPADGALVDIDTLDIAGTVTGEGLLSPVRLTIEFRRPPESTAPPFRSSVALIGTGTTRTFSLPGFTGVPLGPITITAEAENSGGLKGTGSVTITNLPVPIRDRFAADGGAATFGEFSFGLLGACKTAVYQQGLISLNSGGETRVAKGLIFTKWLALRTLNDSDGLGCPLGEERTGPSGRRMQDFQDGRIYILITANASLTTAYVPAVFVDAIEKRGGEAATGVPLADPVSPVEPLTQTWLYQQFERPSRPDLLPSTLEIRGTPPEIWLERQSWNLTIESSGTVYENFPCAGNLGPCSVDPEPPLAEGILNAGELFCDGTTYPWEGVAEWVGIPSANPDYESVPLFGVIEESHMASEDNPFTHEWSYQAAPFCSKAFGCPSDWNLKVRPIGPQPGGFPFTLSLLGQGNKEKIEIEFERFYGDFVVWMGYPDVGDLFYGEGRWIIDCGHDTYNSELHPIFMWSVTRTVTSLVEPFTGLIRELGQPTTRANVWVNGWYPGGPGQEIEFDIFPPPRPTPTATLVVNKPVDEDAATDEFEIAYEFAPASAANHVHVTISAPRHECHVTSAGEMIWEINRGYEGQWLVFWAE